MFTAYEAVAIIPENISMIKTKLGDEVPKYEEILLSRLDLQGPYYIIFNASENAFDLGRHHTITHPDIINECFEIASYNHNILWVTKKK